MDWIAVFNWFSSTRIREVTELARSGRVALVVDNATGAPFCRVDLPHTTLLRPWDVDNARHFAALGLLSRKHPFFTQAQPHPQARHQHWRRSDRYVSLK